MGLAWRVDWDELLSRELERVLDSERLLERLGGGVARVALSLRELLWERVLSERVFPCERVELSVRVPLSERVFRSRSLGW